MILHLDTTFLVDLLRENARGGESGPATAFLARRLDDELRASLFVFCELRLGVERADRRDQEHRRVEELLTVVPVAVPTVAVASIYGRVLAHLQRQGETLATMDLLIAATALAEGAPIVTRNAGHFRRVPELRVLDY